MLWDRLWRGWIKSPFLLWQSRTQVWELLLQGHSLPWMWHLLRVCGNKQSPKFGRQQASRKKSIHLLEEGSEEALDDSTENYSLPPPPSQSPTKRTLKWMASWKLIPVPLWYLSEATFKSYWPELNLSPSGVTLHSYSSEPIPVIGTVDVGVKYGAILPLLVVKGERPSP